MTSTTTYNYDRANGLTSVNGVTYTWDDNGNLLNDGVNTYAYDSANRLKTFSGPGVNATYSYSGLGDRLSQTVNGSTTNYTLDLNSGLTQVLSDGTNTYLYGLGRIAQANTTTEYFLGDALSSVRQLTDSQGSLTLAKSYAPYGETLASAGSGASAFAFTGEQQDPSGLTYLRSRYYTSGMGRFLTKDSWMGSYNRPQSLNQWNYVEGNPVNRADPSGKCWYPNAQTGGTSVDPSDSSSGICPWFVNALQQNGITIPANATPGNWINSIPPDHRALIASFTTCVFKNDTFLSAPNDDFWTVIRFYTRPQWHFYSSSNTKYLDVDLSLIGLGGDVEFSCDNNSSACTTSYGYSIGQGVSIRGYNLALKAGLAVDVDTTGEIQLGATAQAGPCGLFANFIRISIECQYFNFGVTETIEVGWTRDALPQEYWVLAKESVFDSLSYEDFAKRRLPFSAHSKIYYRVEYLGSRDLMPRRYINYIDYVVE